MRALKRDNLIIASVCLSRMRYSSDMSTGPLVVDVVLLECRVWQSDCLCDMDILSAEFFDDESVVLLYRYQKNDGALIAYLQGNCSDHDRTSRTNDYSNVRLQRFRVPNSVA